MIICSRCKTENDDNVKFCRECGNNLTLNVDAPAQEELKNLADTLNEQAVHTEKQPFNLNKALSEIPSKIWKALKKSVFFNKKKNTIITFSSALLIILLVFGILNSGYIAFTVTYNTDRFDTAKSIQGWPFNSNSVKSNIEKFVIGKTESYYDDFYAEKTTYEEATEKLDIAKNFTGNNDAKNKTDKLQTSRTSFKKAEEYKNNGDFFNAVIEYLKVIEEDKNYNAAKEKIEKSKPSVKQQAISQMDNCAAVNDFNTGLKIVSDMEKIFTDDTDINNYKKDFENRKEAHRIQELKNNQKVKVLSASTYNDGYYLVFRKGRVVLQNCSDKVLKEATIVFLTFDSNGYPVDADYSMYTDSDVENTNRCGTGSINLQPGSTWGYRYSWNIAENATKVKACIKTAEFYDDEKWTNPYYEHWLKTEKDRF